jgi:hypothetical protein
MRPLAAGLAIALLATSAAVADANVCRPSPSPAKVPEELLTNLTGWIALHTMYDVRQLDADPPRISFCVVGSDIAYEDGSLRVESELNAAYDLPNRVVYLVLPWTASDAYDRSVLLHELIHDVQLSNRDWACTGEPEWEAYTLQAIYLQEHGIMPSFDWDAIRRLSTCPPGDQP